MAEHSSISQLIEPCLSIPMTGSPSSLPIHAFPVDCDVEMSQELHQFLPIDPEDERNRQFWQCESQKRSWESDFLAYMGDLEEEQRPESSGILSLPGTIFQTTAPSCSLLFPASIAATSPSEEQKEPPIYKVN
jgi:hypothetical protein